MQWYVAAAVHSLKGAPLELAMLHKVVPQAGAVLKGQGVLAPIQLEVEAARAPGCHDRDAGVAVHTHVVCICIALCCDGCALHAVNSVTCITMHVPDSPPPLSSTLDYFIVKVQGSIVILVT